MQKSIDELPFAVSCYAENSPGKEEFGNELPINVLVNDPGGETYNKKLIISPESSHSFSMQHEDTIEFYEINAQIDQYYGKFKVVRGPAFNPHFTSQVIRFNNQFELYEQYYHNIKLEKTDQPNTIVLSTIALNPLKGKAFLNKILQLYNKDKINTISDYNSSNDDSLHLIRRQIEILKLKVKEEFLSVPAKNHLLSQQQVKIVQILKPYLQKPVRQFVQIPYVEEIEDVGLKNDLNHYNMAELAKQRLLGEAKTDDLAITSVDKELSSLKGKLLKQVDDLSDPYKPVTKSNELSESTEKELRAALIKYKNLISKNHNKRTFTNSAAIKIAGNQQGEISEVQPDANWILALALILGISVPLLLTAIEILNDSIATRTWFDSQNSIEKIKILIGAKKQID